MSTVTEIASLARQISNASGLTFPVPDSEATARSLVRNADGAWEYRFETDAKWGFVTAGPETCVETSIETTCPGWGTLTVEPGHWAVFYRGTLAGVVSQDGGRIRWYAPPIRDDYPPDLESAMYDAFAAELDALLPSVPLWLDPKGDSHPSIDTGGDE